MIENHTDILGIAQLIAKNLRQFLLSLTAGASHWCKFEEVSGVLFSQGQVAGQKLKNVMTRKRDNVKIFNRLRNDFISAMNAEVMMQRAWKKILELTWNKGTALCLSKERINV